MTTDISVRYDPITQTETNEEYDGGNSSSRLFERARIKALAGKTRPRQWTQSGALLTHRYILTLACTHNRRA